jgi:hypothetical protein
MPETPSTQNESITMIVDTSSSAAAWLEETKQMAQRIYYLAGLEQFKIFTLDSPTPISPTTLKQISAPDFGQPSQTCSLIAPVMEVLAREEQQHSLIIVGNGEIFDLDDWIDDPHVDGWLLIRVGDQPLQGKEIRLPEIKPEKIQDKETLFGSFSQPICQPDDSGYEPHEVAYEWKVDASGYPLIWVEPLACFVHLFPVAKPQFEKFMASGKRQGFGDEWYAERLGMNPRASYRSQDITAREQLFMTGVSTDEVLSFSRWLGREYTLLRAGEWRACYNWFAEQLATSPPGDLSGRLSRDALAIWEIIDGQCQDQCREQQRHPKLQDLSLMTQGILEWVVEQPGRYCGFGDRYQRQAFEPVYLVEPERRLSDMGFRLRAG